jgi:tetratricopeptide (TPR) repeat protein
MEMAYKIGKGDSMNRRICGIVLSAAVLALWGGGCRKATAPAGSGGGGARAGGPPDRAVFETLMRAESCLASGRVDAAIATLDAVLWQRPYRDVRAEICGRLLTMYLSTNQVAEAQQKYLEVARRDKQAALRCYGIIENHLFQQQRFDELLAWCDRVAGLALGNEVLVAVADWRFKGLFARGDMHAAEQVLSAFQKPLTPAQWQNLAARFGQALLAARAAEGVEGLLKLLDAESAARPDLLAIRAALQIDWFALNAQWEQASEYLRTVAGRESDPLANQLLCQLIDHLTRSAQLDAVDQECRFFLYSVKDRPSARETAAQRYFRVALQREDVSAALSRIEELQQAGFGAATAAAWMDSLYSLAMQKGAEPDFRKMVTLCLSYLGEVKDERQRSSLAGMVLDAGFRAEMFREALQVLEAKIPGQTEAWHASMINKVKAHIALKEGRKEEAVQRFKQFMEESVAKMEDTVDPISGDRITREMVLALNAKRIGGILASLGQQTEADEFFAQARTHYAAALKTVEAESGQYQRLKAEMDALPAAR